MAPKLAYLCSDPGVSLHGKKGAAVHFRQMAGALRRQGFGLDVFLGREDKEPRSERNLTVIEAPRSAGVDGELELIAASTRMNAALQRRGPHLGIYERFSLFGIAGLAYSRAVGIPHIVEINAPLWEEASRFRNLSLDDVALGLARIVLVNATRVIAVTPALGEILVREGIPGDKVEVRANGVDANLFTSCERASKPERFGDRKVMLFIGSLKPWHGIEFLCDAFLECADQLNLGLWIVGDGPLRETVNGFAERDPQRIVWQGHVDHEQIPDILLAADMVVAPYPEDAPVYFSPLKLVEAQAAGRPILASDHPAVRSALYSGSIVELYAPGDSRAFAKSAQRLLSSERKARAVKVPTWDDHARRIREILEDTKPEAQPISRPT
ncbi:MAG: glycosyltransferase family 4 protein [Planctomycetota bacterium]|jgi:glycosyltransferase involved in cell wall biosynthesis